MADIELVIKIPEEVKQTFDNAKNEDLYANYYDRNSLIGKAIQNGITLPKGHGRLIDENELIDEIVREEIEGRYYDVIYAHSVYDAETIIEADKERSDKE